MRVLALTAIAFSILLVGCGGEKEEVNPQVVNNPSPELQEKHRAAGADAAGPGGGTPSTGLN